MDQGYLKGQVLSYDLMVDVPEIGRQGSGDLARCKTPRVLAQIPTSMVIV